MNSPPNIAERLIECFQTVFPGVPAVQIPSVSQATTPAWDSIAAITLVSVLEDEFQIQLDLDAVADLDSFKAVLEYLERQGQTA